MKKNKSLKIFLFATLALLSIGLVSYKVFAASVTGSTTVIVDGTISPDLKVNLNGSSYVVANQSDGPLMVSYNSAYNLSWDKVDGATSCVLDGYYPADVNGGSVNWRAEGWAGNTHDFKLECTDGTITGTNTVKLSYPPAPTNMKTSCNADGTKVTLTWTNATGYNNLYTRVHVGPYQDPYSGPYLINDDTASGSSLSFDVTPNTDYTAWVHSRADNGASSIGLFPNDTTMTVNCPGPKINPDLKVSVNYIGSPKVDNSDGPEMISYNSPYTLSWDKVLNATSCKLDWTSPADVDGGKVEWRATNWGSTNSHDFILKCTGANGIVGSDTVHLSYPPAPTNMKTVCSADGKNVALTWTNAAGYKGQVYTRVHKGEYQDPYLGGYMIYGDDVVGNSLSFNVDPSTTYTAWVHTRADSGVYSAGLFTNDTTMDFQCVPVGEVAGTLTGPDCNIALNESTCKTTLTQSITNPVSGAATNITKPINTEVAKDITPASKPNIVVEYPGTMFYLNHNGTTIASTEVKANCGLWDNATATCKKVAEEVCANGAKDYPTCSTCSDGSIPPVGGNCPSSDATGVLTISPNHCEIAEGRGACKVVGATWTTTKTTNPSLEDANTGSTLSSLANKTTPLEVWAAYPQTVFKLKDDATVLDTKIVTTSCVSGTTWDPYGNDCAKTPVLSVTLTATPAGPLTAPGATTLSWTATGSPDTCDASGVQWSGIRIYNGEPVTERSGMPAGTYVFGIVCHKAGSPDASDTVTVVVNPGSCTNGATNPPSCNNLCSDPITQDVTVDCDIINGVSATSGSVTRSQTKSAACIFPGLPITKENSKYISDDCKYPDGACTNGATNYPTCTLDPDDKCLNGATNPPQCTTCTSGDCGGGGGGGNGDGYWSDCNLTSCDLITKTQQCTKYCIPPTGSGRGCPGDDGSGIWTYMQSCGGGGTDVGGGSGDILGITLEATPSKIFKGRTAVLTWSSNADSCIATKGNGFITGGKARNLSPGIPVSPLVNTEYEITCTKGNVTETKNITIKVDNISIKET